MITSRRLLNWSCMLVGVLAGAGLNYFTGWMDQPQAIIGILVSGLIYLIALIATRDLLRRGGKLRRRRANKRR
jgi:hypothetical protein